MDELAFRSATALAAALRARQIGSRELLEHYLARVDRLNPRLNAVVTLDVEGGTPPGRRRGCGDGTRRGTRARSTGCP